MYLAFLICRLIKGEEICPMVNRTHVSPGTNLDEVFGAGVSQHSEVLGCVNDKQFLGAKG